MITISSLMQTVLTKLRKMPDGHYVEVLTYKKDRALKIVKLEENQFLVIENGFHKEQHMTDADNLRKTLKSLIKKEFPRSKNAHMSSGKFEG